MKAHDVAHEKQDAEVICVLDAFDASVDVLRVKPVVSQAAQVIHHVSKTDIS